MTIAENLTALNQAKQSIKSAFENKNISLDGVPFTEWGSILENASIGGGKTTVNTDVPDNFANIDYRIFTFVADSNTVLVSFGVTKTGLWRYKVDKKEWKKIYESGSSWKLFQEVENGVLISGYPSSSSESPGVLLYEPETDVLTVIETKGYRYDNITKVGNSWVLIGSNATKNTVVYHPDTKTTTVYSNSASANASYRIRICDHDPNQCFIIYSAGYNGDAGIVLYDDSTRSFKNIYNEGSYWGDITDRCLYINGKYLLTSNGSSSTTDCDDLLLYDPVTESIKSIIKLPNYGYVMKALGNNKKVFIYHTTNTYSYGIYVYDVDTESIQLIYEEYIRLITITVSENYAMISTDSSSSSDPISILYNSLDNSIKIVQNTITGIGHLGFTNNGFLFKLNSALKYYDMRTEEFLDIQTLKNSDNSIVYKFKNGRVVLSRTGVSSGGLYIWDDNERTLTQPYTSGGNWKNWVEIENYAICATDYVDSSGKGLGVICYDFDLKTITLIQSNMAYDKIEKVGDNYILSHSLKNKNPLSYEFNPSTKTFKLIKFYLEV